MRDRLLAGEPADLVILTKALIAELAAGGRVLADSCVDLGRVRTGVAIGALAAYPYYSDCWDYVPVYDPYGDYLGEQYVNLCN